MCIAIFPSEASTLTERDPEKKKSFSPVNYWQLLMEKHQSGL